MNIGIKVNLFVIAIHNGSQVSTQIIQINQYFSINLFYSIQNYLSFVCRKLNLKYKKTAENKRPHNKPIHIPVS